ncbi:sugar phosphate isomerase/epimerase [Daejeonella sp.]|uniref:sugar phosphate isomerase/epimerase family protein n=1 Tax=Daejeonella sp. TaxID=2805397 RepID=UPI002717E949|nr:sugar phosphate isomerase/epimerase family protein [Daejeonella sp.]MDO8992830.1 sugar phosphate isomerase/epimerase family protein [Daejeonella sp.]MDP2415843.1 sugar phosphate isomerase/epimerase family protein [Daejeonella sp.]
MDTENNKSRRNFIKSSVIAGTLLPFMSNDLFADVLGSKKVIEPLNVSVFSKHLQFLNYNDMADAAAEIGFNGVDLTVRPKGHVLPERVETDLPKAMEAIRKAGLATTMITTAVQDANDPTDRKLLETASGLGVKYYRMNWLKYPEGKSIPEAMMQFKKTLTEISHLNRKLNITGCYQNHSGNLAGASIWELWEILKNADQRNMGVQYDIRHAVVEGGMSWKNGLNLIHPHVKILAIKDCIWLKKNGSWVVENVPLGEGMVDFKAYFKMLKEFNIQVPVSLHYEYPMGGAEHGASSISTDKQIIFAHMKRDLLKLQQLWQEA